MRPASAVARYEIVVEQTARAAAQTSMRHTASVTRPARSDATMNGNAAATFRKGRSAGIPASTPATYDSAVAPTMTAGTHAGFIPKDYTPRDDAPHSCPAAARGGRRRRVYVELAGPARHGRRQRPRDCEVAGVRVGHSRLRRDLPRTSPRTAEARGLVAGAERRGNPGRVRDARQTRLHQARAGRRRRHQDDHDRIRRREAAAPAVPARVHERHARLWHGGA